MEGEGRRATVSLTYNKKNVTRSLKPYFEQCEYKDAATGQSDELSVTLNNTDMRFINNWKPVKGATISAKITTKDWEKENIDKSFSTGKMVVDDLTASFSPSQFIIKALSAPVKSEFKSTKRKKTYKNVTVESIAGKVAKRAKIKCYYDAGKIKIKEIEQSDQTDSEFLSGICEDYGLGIKVYNDKIIIYDEEKYEKKDPIVIIYRNDDNKAVGKGKNIGGVQEWEWNTTMQGTYQGAKVTYTDSSDNKKHKARVGKKKGRQLKLNVSAFSKKDAQLKAKAALHKENKERTTMTLTMSPDPRLIATTTVKLVGFRKASGKYFIDEVVHKIGGGYTCEVTLHKIPTKKKPQAGGGREDGDTRGGGGA